MPLNHHLQPQPLHSQYYCLISDTEYMFITVSLWFPAKIIFPQSLKYLLQERLQSGHHAAMDFSAGSGGRIITDPHEAAIIAKTSFRLRSYPRTGYSSPALASSKSSLEDLDPSQDVSLPGCSEKWFQPSMCREQANCALFPHRYVITEYCKTFTELREAVQKKWQKCAI